VDARLEEEELPTEPRLARDVGRALVAGDVLVVGSSMPIRDVDAFLAPGPFSMLANRGASGIDGFVSTVLGIAAAGGEGSVVALAGDLSILHDTNGFLLADRPDAVFVIASNDGGGIFSFLPQARFPEHFERIFGTPHGRSFESLASFHGLGYRRVGSPGTVVGEIEQAAEEGGVQLLEVPTDRTTNVELHRRITADVHAALDRERI
jgi:2-succinyl-5-enolpyruvyl-6-hydroxy-3-cyclohexene-1-carboxylate synthase